MARASDDEAHRAANTVATSPLVKTAFFGGDANWGRILAAVGRSGSPRRSQRAALYIDGGPNAATRLGELQLVEDGTPLPYSEEQATAIFAQPEIDVRIELGLGERLGHRLDQRPLVRLRAHQRGLSYVAMGYV